MSWLFSQALVEASSAVTCSDGEPCAQLNVMPTPHKFSRQDKTIEPSNLSRFGLTCAVLTEDLGEALLTSYLAGFRARTSAPQEKALVCPAQGQGFGARWPGSWVKFDPGSSTWKTAQYSLLGDSEPFSGTWPRWGLMRSGESSPLPTPELSTCVSESGFWPTPNVPNGGRSVAHVTDWRGKTAYHNGKKVQVGLEAAVRMWPTPTVYGNHNQPGASKSAGWGLSSAVKLWPTPVASDTGCRSKPYAQGGTALSLAANLYPTPTTMKSTGGAALCKWGGAGARKKMASMVSHSDMNGPLNPVWVEWLMGWPTGWTDLTALEMGKFREWQQQHSIFSAVESMTTPPTEVPA